MTAAGIAAIAGLVLLVEPVREAVFDAVGGDTGSVREDLRGLGVGAALLVVALAVAHAVVWYPAEILDAAAGYVFDFWVALPLIMASWVLSGLIAYYIGRHAARPLLYRFVGEHRFTRLEDLMERGGATFLLVARLVPIVPFSLLGYVAGAAHVPIWRYTWTTAVGYIPITAYFVYLGSRLESLSLSDPVIWLGVVGLIAALYGVRHLMPSNQSPLPAPDPPVASEPALEEEP
ncbi:MAG TPA: VTT domain-containing protein [Solirubrobacterales bacterium]|nr:VTT domain-containing protein [Solirubrobacterales bacterium]